MKLQDPAFVFLDEPFLIYLLGKGLPIGRIVEVVGVPGCGKSMLCCHFAKFFEKVYLFDTERSYTKSWVSKFTNPDKFEVFYPPDAETLFFDLLPKVVSSKSTDLVLIDSVSALQSRDDAVSDQMALHARLYSRGLRVCSTINTAKVVVLVSHLKVNPLRPGQFVRLGGEAISFHAAIQIAIRKRKSGDQILCQMYTVKNKVYTPFLGVTLRITEDFDETLFLIDVAKRYGILEAVGGGWYRVPGTEKKFRVDDALQAVRDDIIKRLKENGRKEVPRSGESFQDLAEDQE